MERVARDAETELLAQLERFATVDELEAQIRAGDPPPELVTTFKLRRVLVLQDGTKSSIQDVAVARINSITSEKATVRERWYQRLQAGTHPTQLLIGQESRHGLAGREGYVDTTSVRFIPKGTIVRRTGTLDLDEMREVSARLVRSLEIDLPTLGET